MIFYLFSVTFQIINHNYRSKGIFKFDIVNGDFLLSKNLTKLKKMQDVSPLVMMPFGKYVVFSSNEMETRTIAKVWFYYLPYFLVISAVLITINSNILLNLFHCGDILF